MSTTPRTDAQVHRLAEPLTGWASYPDTVEVVPAEFARELERRLIAIRALQPTNMATDYWGYNEGLDPDTVFDLCDEALTPPPTEV